MSDDRTRAVAEEILEAFRTGTLPQALAFVFLHRNRDVPSRRWSYRNRLIAALRLSADARGFRQWEEVGRHVRKGERAFYILGPCKRRLREDRPEEGLEAEDEIVFGFRGLPVFDFIQTDGEPIPGYEEQPAFLSSLPLLEVARSWGIVVTTFSAEGGPRAGFYRGSGTVDGLANEADLPASVIGLGVENLATWAHELVHAADDRLGQLPRRGRLPADSARAEIVAELGGAVLLECLGRSVESDRGGAYAYILRYCETTGQEILAACTELLDRTCACVDLILDTAAAFSSPGPMEALPFDLGLVRQDPASTVEEQLPPSLLSRALGRAREISGALA